MTYEPMILAAGLAIVALAVAYRILTGCRHEFETIEIVSVFSQYDSTMPMASLHVLRCKKCGTVIQKKVMA